MANPITALLGRWAGRLRYPQLLAVTAGLFLLDVVIPDLIPFIDEILLGLGTLVLAGMRKPSLPAPKRNQ